MKNCEAKFILQEEKCHIYFLAMKKNKEQTMQLYAKIEIVEESLTANYTKEQKRQFEEYTDLYCECSSILQETAFTYGMKLGIKILLDALKN